MGRRTLLLIAAFVVAALGTVLVFLYAHNADTAAKEGQTLVKVLVAKDKIEAGTTGVDRVRRGRLRAAGDPEVQRRPGRALRLGAARQPRRARPGLPGQQIISQQWGASAPSAGLSIPPGDLALSVPARRPAARRGLRHPRLDSHDLRERHVAGGRRGRGRPQVRTLLTGIKVLAVGPSTVVSKSTGTASGNTEQIPTAILTLALTQDAGQEDDLHGRRLDRRVLRPQWFALQNADSKVVPPAKDKAINADQPVPSVIDRPDPDARPRGQGRQPRHDSDRRVRPHRRRVDQGRPGP